jgi:ubiquinone/menaquinone biosynthesis C-methylase UbiE
MELSQAIQLIHHPGLAQPGKAHGADLGCGSGLFTYALAHWLPNGSVIYAIDKSEVALSPQPKPDQTLLEPIQLDFITQPLNLPPLDGILMANSLHYVPAKTTFLAQLRTCLKEHGCLLVVEYDTDTANPWVPFPINYTTLQRLSETAGFTSVTWLGERTSVYGRAKMYATLMR